MILAFNYLNSCNWLITDHKLAIEDKSVKEEPTHINIIAPIATWLVVLNNLANSDALVSCCAGWEAGKFQFPELKLKPGLQVVQTEESETVHIWQLLAKHLLTVKLIIFWTSPDIPETVESM